MCTRSNATAMGSVAGWSHAPSPCAGSTPTEVYRQVDSSPPSLDACRQRPIGGTEFNMGISGPPQGTTASLQFLCSTLLLAFILTRYMNIP